MILGFIRQDVFYPIESKEIIIRPCGKKTFKINNEFILNKRDYIIYTCDETGEKITAKFKLGDRFTGKNTFSTSIYKKRNNIEKYGVDNPAKLKKTKEKISKTKKEKTEEEKEEANFKRRQTNLKKYGVESYNSLDYVKEKKKQTWMEKYNGVGFQSDSVLEKSKNTKHKRYGNIYYNNSEKTKKTNLERYGVDNVRKSDSVKEKIRKTQIENYFENISAKKKIIEKVDPMFNSGEYINTDYENKYRWKCKSCSTEFYDHLYSGNIPKCPICFPKNRSSYEHEIESFLIKNNVEFKKNFKNKKDGIFPYEIDFYLEKHKLGIEFNGAYWHSTIWKDKYYHYNKTLMCYKKGIRLLHIFEDDWVDKKSECKNRIFYYIENSFEDIKPREPILEKRMGYDIWF